MGRQRRFAIVVITAAIVAVVAGAGVVVGLTATPEPLPDFVLERALISQSDLSPDFRVEPDSADSPETDAVVQEGAALAEKCIAGRIPATQFFSSEEPRPNSGYLEGQGFTAESSNASVFLQGLAFDAPGGAVAEIEALASVYECMGDLLRPVMSEVAADGGASLDSIAVTKIPNASLGSSGVAIRVRAMFSSVQGSGPMDLFYVAYGSGRIVGAALILVVPGSDDTAAVDGVSPILVSKVSQAAAAVLE